VLVKEFLKISLKRNPLKCAVYVDIGANAGDIATLIFTLDAAGLAQRSWDIKVTQVECSNSGAWVENLFHVHLNNGFSG